MGIGIFGKEGNQASSFADYALPRFKDIRRLIFWHGSSFSYKLANAILWCIFKSTIFGSSVWFFNFSNGFSGHHTIDDLLWATYNICLTNIALGSYIVLENGIFFTYSTDENLLPFRMADYYAMTK